jgi:2-polyprenyl-3-methyl-5-hydroxy-6-metoxy-1,4-benzoquinol methylase
MSKALWDNVLERLNEHGYMSEVQRTAERVKNSGEVFTPSPLVVEMMSRLPIASFSPGLKVLDPACGDGQFLVAAKWVKILAHSMSEAAALEDLYGVDIMRDNVRLCRARLGGGTILLGDTLNPGLRLSSQTDEEHRLMRELFVGDLGQVAVWND